MSHPLQGLYAITDPALTPGDRVLSAAEAALRGGATLLQYRDKPADADTRRHRAARLALLCKDHGARFIVNDDAALAAEVEADGVHLGQSDGAVSRARMLLGDDKLIGVSCHGRLDLAQKAADEGADYLALGGVNPHNARQLIEAGADLVAVIHALFGHADDADVEAAARRLHAAFPAPPFKESQ
jgi:thiamine-phosphate pyrophosphorylase